LAVVVTAIVVFLPALLSTDSARRTVVAAVAKKTGASLDVDSWRFSWIRGLEVGGIRFRRGDLRVRVSEVSSDAGLWGLLVGSGSSKSEVRIVSPSVDYVAESPSRPAKTGVGSRKSKPPLPPHASSGGFVSSLLAGVKARCVVSGGRMRFVRFPGGPVLTTDEVGGTLELATLLKPVPVEFSGRLVEGRGGWRVAGMLFPPTRVGGSAADMRAELDCRWAGVALGYVDDWLPTNGIPALAGVSKGEIGFALRGAGDFAATGHVSVAGLRCSGGALGNDKLRVETVDMDVGVTARDGVVKVNRFTLQSPVLRGQFKGAFGRSDAGTASRSTVAALSRDMSVTLWLDAAALATQLPETLSIRDGLEVNDGQISLAGRVSSTDDSLNYDVRFEARDIAAVENGRAIELRAPIRFVAKGGLATNGLFLEHFDLGASFANAKGKGTWDELSFDLSADLGAACAELGAFFELGREVGGRLAAGVSWNTPSRGRRGIDVHIALEQFALSGKEGGTISVGDASLAFDGDLRFSGEGSLIGGGRSVFALTSEVARASLSVGSFALDDSGGLKLASDVAVSSEGDIGRTVEVLNRLGLATNLPVSGKAYSLAAAGTYLEKSARIRRLDVAVDGLQFPTNLLPGVEEDVRFGFAGALAEEGVEIKALRLETRPLLLTCWGEIGDGPNGRDELRARGTLTCDYEHLTRIARAWKPDFAWELAGRQSSPFFVQVPLGMTDPRVQWRNTQAELPLRMSRASAYGMVFGPVSSTLRVESGIVSTRIETTLNDGRFACQPRLDMRCEPPLLTMDGPQRLLGNVRLTQDMATALLADVHPFFGACEVIGEDGRIHVDVENLSMPIGDETKRGTIFEGALTLTNVTMDVGGLLAQVLALAKIEVDKAVISHEEIAFDCRDGWVSATPLTVDADVTEVTLSGRVGLDGALDYTVDVPLTREMFKSREKLWKYLEGARVTVVVGGTVDKPEISPETWRVNYDRLLKKAMENLLREESSRLLEKLFK